MNIEEARKRENIKREEQFEEKLLYCKICGKDFLWTSGEQCYYYDRGLAEPKRCKQCRWKRHDLEEDKP